MQGLFVLLLFSVCVCVCMLMCVTMHIWKLEDNLLELVFYHVGPMGSNSDGQALCIYMLSHLTSSDSFKKCIAHAGQHPGSWVGSSNI